MSEYRRNKRRCYICDVRQFGLTEVDFAFHKFPTNDCLSAWRAFCNLSDEDDVSRLVLCSKHFTPDQFSSKKEQIEKGRRLRLKTTAIPTLKSEQELDQEPLGPALPSLRKEAKPAVEYKRPRKPPVIRVQNKLLSGFTHLTKTINPIRNLNKSSVNPLASEKQSTEDPFTLTIVDDTPMLVTVPTIPKTVEFANNSVEIIKCEISTQTEDSGPAKCVRCCLPLSESLQSSEKPAPQLKRKKYICPRTAVNINGFVFGNCKLAKLRLRIARRAIIRKKWQIKIIERDLQRQKQKMELLSDSFQSYLDNPKISFKDVPDSLLVSLPKRLREKVLHKRDGKIIRSKL